VRSSLLIPPTATIPLTVYPDSGPRRFSSSATIYLPQTISGAFFPLSLFLIRSPLPFSGRPPTSARQPLSVVNVFSPPIVHDFTPPTSSSPPFFPSNWSHRAPSFFFKTRNYTCLSHWSSVLSSLWRNPILYISPTFLIETLPFKRFQIGWPHFILSFLAPVLHSAPVPPQMTHFSVWPPKRGGLFFLSGLLEPHLPLLVVASGAFSSLPT